MVIEMFDRVSLISGDGDCDLAVGAKFTDDISGKICQGFVCGRYLGSVQFVCTGDTQTGHLLLPLSSKRPDGVSPIV